MTGSEVTEQAGYGAFWQAGSGGIEQGGRRCADLLGHNVVNG